MHDLWEFAWKKFAFLVCFYWMILENALPITGSGPATIYRTILKLTSEPRFPSFCVHVIKNGFKCPRCVAEQQSLEVSAVVCQNQHCSHHSSSQQCWLQQFSWWYFASLVLSPFQITHTETSFSCVLALFSHSSDIFLSNILIWQHVQGDALRSQYEGEELIKLAYSIGY